MADDARLAALAALGVGVTAAPEAPATIELTGREVYAGGDVSRTLAMTVVLTYVDADGVRWYPANGQPGDVVTVTAEQAARFDRLGATILDDSEDAPNGDANLDAMDASALKEYAGTSEEAAARVLAYESARPESKQRPTVIEAAKAVLDEGAAEPTA